MFGRWARQRSRDQTEGSSSSAFACLDLGFFFVAALVVVVVAPPLSWKFVQKRAGKLTISI